MVQYFLDLTAFLMLILKAPTFGLILDFTKIKDAENDLRLENTRNVKKFNKTMALATFAGSIPRISKIGNSGIVGGYHVPFQISKHLASLFIHTTLGSRISCTGSILNNYLVISAAHCFKGGDFRFNMAGVYLRFGQYRNKDKLYSAKYADIFDQYNVRTRQHDVALLWFDGPIKTSYKTFILVNQLTSLKLDQQFFLLALVEHPRTDRVKIEPER